MKAAALVVAAIAALLSAFAAADEFIPLGARRFAPILAARQAALWPDAVEPYTLGGLVEQETCASLKSRKCWSATAELKTAREYGFGLGQVTIAYNTDGSERFNEFNTLRKQYTSLAAWSWADRYNPDYQLTAIVEMMHALWRRIPPASGATSQWAFTLNAYNGGLGGLLQDRRLCASSAGCDPMLWFGNVETHSYKSRAPQKAYGGQSFFKISRDYPRNVLFLRRGKYRQFWQPAPLAPIGPIA